MIMVGRLKALCLCTLILLLALPAWSGTITGTVAAPNTSLPLRNATFTLRLSQSAYVPGSYALTTDAVQCFTSTDGSVVGLPNPLVAPTVTPDTASGTLPAATYFVAISYYDATTETLISPERTVLLSGTGRLIIAVPTVQPAAATGFRVYIGTVSGALFRQTSVVGFGAGFTQSIPLVSVTSPPVTNNSVCSLRFNDELIPTNTDYLVSAVNSAGGGVGGYPTRSRFLGGTNGSVNVSNGWPVSPGYVIYPQGVLLNPPANATQSINGPLTLNGWNLTANRGIFTQADGTEPITVTSKTPPNNLTAKRLNLSTIINTATQVTESWTNPALARIYTHPDPGADAWYVMSTGGPNSVDCTGILTCTLTTKIYWEFGGANGSQASIGWDTFSTNGCVAGVITGSNTIKGVCKFKAAVNLEQQQQNNLNPVSATTITLTGLTTTAGDLLVAVVSVLGSATISGCTDGVAYTLAKRQQNGTALGVEVWYRQNATALSSATLTCTASVGSVMALQFYEYSGAAAVALDTTQGGTGTGTSLSTTPTATTAQASELVFSASTIAGTGVAFTTGSGFSIHSVSQNTQSTGITGFSQGSIANATGTFTGPHSIGVSAVWAEAIVTFKAASASAPTQTAQRGYQLPADFVAPLNVNWSWFNPQAAGTGLNVQMGIATMCTASGATDDSAFNAASTTTVAVPGVTRTLTITPINAVTITGCDPGEIMHIQPQRLSGNVNDNYEREIEAYGLEFTATRAQ
jgi:hypothetical protein